MSQHARHPRRFAKGRHDHEGIIGTRQAPTWDADSLFAAPVLQTPTVALHGLTRGSDPIESQRSAVSQVEGRSKLQARILTLIATIGPMNGAELERRPELAHLSPSTARKRLSELKQLGVVVQVARRDGMAVYDLKVSRETS